MNPITVRGKTLTTEPVLPERLPWAPKVRPDIQTEDALLAMAERVRELKAIAGAAEARSAEAILATTAAHNAEQEAMHLFRTLTLALVDYSGTDVKKANRLTVADALSSCVRYLNGETA